MTVRVCPFHTTKNATDWYSFRGGGNQVIAPKNWSLKKQNISILSKAVLGKKVPSGSLVQWWSRAPKKCHPVNFFAGQVIFKAYLANVPGSRQVILWQNHLWKLARNSLEQGKCESFLPGKGQMKFKFFSGPRKGTYTRQVILRRIINQNKLSMLPGASEIQELLVQRTHLFFCHLFHVK